MTMNENDLRRGIAMLSPWFHKIDLPYGLTTKTGSYAGEPDDHPVGTWRHVQPVLPADLTGKTVLDVGCNGGFYSIQAHRLGASYVLGVDEKRWHVRQAQFASAANELKDIAFRRASLYALDPARDGAFDVVLALGLTYHLKHLIRGLEILFDMCKEILVLETAVLDSVQHPAFTDAMNQTLYPIGYVKNDPFRDEAAHNWFIPTGETIKAMLEDVGFSRVEIRDHFYGRCLLAAHKAHQLLDSRCPAFLGARLSADLEKINGVPGDQVLFSVTATNTGRGKWLSISESTAAQGIVSLAVEITTDEDPLFSLHLPRYPITHDVYPGQAYTWVIPVSLPSKPGCYQLELDLVREDVTFFQDTGSDTKVLAVQVG